VAPAAVALLAVPGDLLAQGEGGGGGALFSINPGLSIWTVAIFLILLAILWKFAWGPILGAVEAREERIQGALDESARKQAEAQRLLEEHKQQLADARRQAQEIIAEGKAAGEKVRRDIEEKAREEGQALIERAKREIEREKESAISELRRESVELAMAAAAKLMHEKMDADRDRRLVTGYVENLTREGTTGGAAGLPSGSRGPGAGA
jgi:F-type H+-transporting ATPase subunit b